VDHSPTDINLFIWRKIFDENFDAIHYRCSTEMERDGIWEIHSLLIKDVALEDGGTYQLKATNRVGTTEETGTLVSMLFKISFSLVKRGNKLDRLFY
jgi:hypothetical protein